MQRLPPPKRAAKKIGCLLLVSAQPFRVSVEQFHEACLVKITYRGVAIRLDPFGMLDPQVVVNLLPELGISVDLARHGSWLVRFKYGARRFI